MKNFQKGSITLAVLIVILGASLAFYFYNNPIQNRQKITQLKLTPTQPKTIQPTSANQKIITKAAKTKIDKVGTPFTLWNVEYKVISATNHKPKYDFNKTAGKYIAVKIEITNVGKTETGVSRIYLKDNKDRQYEMAMLGYQQLSVDDYGEQKIKPGITKIYGAIFEVAKDSTGLSLEYPTKEGPIAASIDLGI